MSTQAWNGVRHPAPPAWKSPWRLDQERRRAEERTAERPKVRVAPPVVAPKPSPPKPPRAVKTVAAPVWCPCADGCGRLVNPGNKTGRCYRCQPNRRPRRYELKKRSPCALECGRMILTFNTVGVCRECRRTISIGKVCRILDAKNQAAGLIGAASEQLAT